MPVWAAMLLFIVNGALAGTLWHYGKEGEKLSLKLLAIPFGFLCLFALLYIFVSIITVLGIMF